MMLQIKKMDMLSSNLLVKQVSPVTNIQNDNTFVIGGAFAYILKLSRLFGMAPLRFEPHRNGYRIFTSTAMTVYSYVFIAVLEECDKDPVSHRFVSYSGSAALIGKILDTNTSSPVPGSKLSQMVSLCLDFIVVLMAVVGVIGAPKRMRNMLSYMNTIASVDKSLSSQYSPAKERKLLIPTGFFLIFIAAMIAHDIYLAWNKTLIAFFSRSSVLVAWYSVVILNLQFVFTTMSVCARFRAVNQMLALTASNFSQKCGQLDKYNEISSSAYVLDVILFAFRSFIVTENKLIKRVLASYNVEKMGETTLPDVLNIFAILKAPSKSVADRAQIVVARKSIIAEPRLIVSPSVAVQKITLLREQLCDVLNIVDENYGLPVIVMLLSILGYIIVIPYYIISHINDPASWHKIHFILSMFIWCMIYVMQLFIIVEPCHNTIKEAKNTKSLICKMMMSSPATNSTYFQLEFLFQQLLLQTDSYEPMCMCTLSRSLLVSIFGAVITYLVILVQLQNNG